MLETTNQGKKVITTHSLTHSLTPSLTPSLTRSITHLFGGFVLSTISANIIILILCVFLRPEQFQEVLKSRIILTAPLLLLLVLLILLLLVLGIAIGTAVSSLTFNDVCDTITHSLTHSLTYQYVGLIECEC